FLSDNFEKRFELAGILEAELTRVDHGGEHRDRDFKLFYGHLHDLCYWRRERDDCSLWSLVTFLQAEDDFCAVFQFLKRESLQRVRMKIDLTATLFENETVS